MGRQFQLIVWGATGFTGSLVCEHIAADYQAKHFWHQSRNCGDARCENDGGTCVTVHGPGCRRRLLGHWLAGTRLS